MTTSPMLLKVFSEFRYGESGFEVRGRRHVGESAFTAIDVPWRVPVVEAHPTGNRPNVEDAKWFRVTGTVRSLPRTVGAIVTVRRAVGVAPFRLRLHRWANGANVEVDSAAADGSGVAEMRFGLGAGEDLRFAILRDDAGLGALGYEIELRCDVRVRRQS